MAATFGEALLTSVLTNLAQACQPVHEDWQRRLEVLNKTKQALENLASVARPDVVAYGSFISGFYNSGSDLDLSFTGWLNTRNLPQQQLLDLFRDRPQTDFVELSTLEKSMKARVLRKISQRLQDHRITSRHMMEHILHARVPILKFVDSMTGVECDLCIGGAGTPFKAWFIQQVARISPAFCDLFRVVKAWAKVNGINDGSQRSFNSWCLTLLVIFYLQHEHKLLPPLYQLLYSAEPLPHEPRLLQGQQEFNREAYSVVEQRCTAAVAQYGSLAAPPLGALFTGFVSTVGRMLGALITGSMPRDTRISAFYGRLIPSAPFEAAAQHQYVLLVEDPFDATDNTARTLGFWDRPDTNMVDYLYHVFDRSTQRLSTITNPSASDQAASEGGVDMSMADKQAAAAVSLAFVFGPALVGHPTAAQGLYADTLMRWVNDQQAAQRGTHAIHQEILVRLGDVEGAQRLYSQERWAVEHRGKKGGGKSRANKKVLTPEEQAARRAKNIAKQTRKDQRRLAQQQQQMAGSAAGPEHGHQLHVQDLHRHEQPTHTLSNLLPGTAAAASTMSSLRTYALSGRAAAGEASASSPSVQGTSTPGNGPSRAPLIHKKPRRANARTQHQHQPPPMDSGVAAVQTQLHNMSIASGPEPPGQALSQQQGHLPRPRVRTARQHAAALAQQHPSSSTQGQEQLRPNEHLHQHQHQQRPPQQRQRRGSQGPPQVGNEVAVAGPHLAVAGPPGSSTWGDAGGSHHGRRSMDATSESRRRPRPPKQ